MISSLGPTSAMRARSRGVDGCWGHDIEVDETTSAVTISLVTGAIPRAWEGCDGLAVEHTTLVEIAEPLGGRKIVDGNAE